MKDFRQRAFVGLVGLVSAGLISFGCSSSSNNSGTGGSTGSGGTSSHTGGTTGSSTGGTTTTGSGGAGGGTSAGSCGPAGTGTTAAPVAMSITDFSDATVAGADAGASAGNVSFGSSTTVQGGATSFHDSGSTKGTISITGGAMQFMASVTAPTTTAMYPFNGVVVYFNGPACTNGSQYTGVSFSISGDLGTCGLVFSINDAEHGDSTTGADPRFTGAAGSYAPQLNITSMVSSTKATIQVPFNDASFANGMPAFSSSGIDASNLTGVQWQFIQPSTTATAACTATITVDDVTFY